jgi:glycerol-3-phosphate acyltransferase PlsY
MIGRDIRELGSGNIGAANMARAGGIKAGLIVAVLDMFKGTVPVLVGQWMNLDSSGLALVAVAAVLGHDYSIFLRLHGGKGVATTFGAALALAPIATVLAMVTWLAIIAISGYSSLASLTALVLLPVLMFLTGQPPPFVVAALGLLAVGTWKHRQNIVRLTRGEESSFRKKLKPANGA